MELHSAIQIRAREVEIPDEEQEKRDILTATIECNRTSYETQKILNQSDLPIHVIDKNMSNAVKNLKKAGDELTYRGFMGKISKLFKKQ